MLAFLFVVLRIAYIMMYVGRPGQRTQSIIWALALLANIGILFSSFL